MPCTKPPSIWPRVDAEVHRIAGVVQNIDAPDVMHAGEAIDFHFAHRRADREVVERLPAAGLAIVVMSGVR